jgi:alkaline phosphatase
MVEGERTTSRSPNDAATALRETIAFDGAVRVAYDYYRKHPRETLVVVLGDHETGGMSVESAAGTKRLHSILALQKNSYLRFDSFMAKYIRTHTSRTARFSDVAGELAAFFGFRYPAGSADSVALDGADVRELRGSLRAELRLWSSCRAAGAGDVTEVQRIRSAHGNR